MIPPFVLLHLLKIMSATTWGAASVKTLIKSIIHKKTHGNFIFQ